MKENKCKKLSRQKRGATLTGYGLAVGLIAVISISAINAMGVSVRDLFGKVGDEMDAVATSSSGGGGGSGTNQAPAIPSLSAMTIEENNVIGAVIGTVSASDPDGDNVSFSLAAGGDNNFFQIGGVGGDELQAAQAFNFEAPQDADSGNDYEITLIATDDGSPFATSQSSFTVTITDDVLDTGLSGQPLCGGVFDAGLGVDGIPSTDDTHPLPVNGGPGCDDGTGAIFAGQAPDGINFFVAHCDIGMTSSGGSCTGSRSTTPWGEASITTNTDSAISDIAPGTVYTASGADNGKANTLTLLGEDSDGGEAGVQPHEAAEACNNLTAHGRSVGTYYLPSIGELDIIYANLTATNDPDHPVPSVDHSSEQDNSGSSGPIRTTFNNGSWPSGAYWSSSEKNSGSFGFAWYVRFSDGNQADHYKHSQINIRCALR